MKFAAFGRTKMLYNSINCCVEQGHEIVLIGTCTSSPEYSRTEDDFAKLAEFYNCPFFNDPAINRKKYIEMVQASDAEVAISVNWLTLVKQPLIDQFKYGILNAHAGDLPRYRGNACPNWAILAGEDKIVITIHQMSINLDAGPILLQREFPLASDTYIQDVYDFLSINIPEMFAQVLDGLDKSTIIPRAQTHDPAFSLRCFPRLPQDSEIDWNKSAEEIAHLVHASAEPFAGAYTYWKDQKLIVWRAYAEKCPYPYKGVPGQIIEIRKATHEVVVLTVQDFLVLQEVEYEDNTRCSPEHLFSSTRDRVGLNLSLTISDLQARIYALERIIN